MQNVAECCLSRGKYVTKNFLFAMTWRVTRHLYLSFIIIVFIFMSTIGGSYPLHFLLVLWCTVQSITFCFWGQVIDCFIFCVSVWSTLCNITGCLMPTSGFFVLNLVNHSETWHLKERRTLHHDDRPAQMSTITTTTTRHWVRHAAVLCRPVNVHPILLLVFPVNLLLS